MRKTRVSNYTRKWPCSLRRSLPFSRDPFVASEQSRRNPKSVFVPLFLYVAIYDPVTHPCWQILRALAIHVTAVTWRAQVLFSYLCYFNYNDEALSCKRWNRRKAQVPKSAQAFFFLGATTLPYLTYFFQFRIYLT